MRGYDREGVVAKIRQAGGEVYAITSEPQALASRAHAAWELGFECVGDPHHEIATLCRERGWLELFVNQKLGFLAASARFTPRHPKGYFQPGVLALGGAGRVLYRWRGVPTRGNMGGAAERPTPSHVWSRVADALAAPDTPDADFDERPPIDARGVPWPLFVALLVANGWFVEPCGFPYAEDGPSPEARVLRAGVRLLGFTAAWAAALWWLPALLVVPAFAGWAAWIAPKVRVINDEFQNEPAAGA